MVALDVSESMLAEDIKPNRLSRAKLEIADLMTRLGGDEVGLVLFSGASFIQFPLTSDYTTARSFLDGARPGVISKPGTNIGDAVRTAMTGFDENSNAQRVIVLITDGEGHDAEQHGRGAAGRRRRRRLLHHRFWFARRRADSRISTPPAIEVGFKQDRNGEIVLSRLDEATLQRSPPSATANSTGLGSGAELDALVVELNQLQQGEIGSQLEVRRIERYQIFLALSLALLVISMLIPDRVSNRKMAQRRNVMMGEKEFAA